MNIAVVSKNKDKYSETFIHNQVRHLPFNVHYLYNGYLPEMYNGDKRFIDDNIISATWAKWTGREYEKRLKDAIAEYLIKNGVKVVLANYALSAIPFLDICAATGIPLVVHFHGYTAYRNDIYELYKDGYARLFKEASAIIAVSDHMALRLQSIGAPSARIQKIVYGIDPALFHNSTETRKENTILYSGRFCDTKNPHLVILAFQKLLQLWPQAQLIMVGDGELMPACVNLVKALGLTHKIEFKGALPNEKVADEMRKAAVFVQFSATAPNNDTEGTPLCILEAGLSGLPIVASTTGGIPEIITDGKTGLLVNQLDIDGLAKGIKELLTNRQNAGQMALALSAEIKQHYTLQQYIDKLAGVLQQVANDKKSKALHG